MTMLNSVAQAGIDNHKNFGSMGLRDGQGQKAGHMRLDYWDREKLARQLELLPEGTPVIVEGSFGWSWLCDEIERRNLMPHLASALKVSMFRAAKCKAKSNRIDCDALSELRLDEPWWEVWLAPRAVRNHREILRFRMGLVQEQTRVKNQIHALTHRHGIRYDFSDLFGSRGRQFLAELAREPRKDDGDKEPPVLREATRAVLRGHLAQLDHLRGQIAQATRMFRKQVVRDPVARILRTIPGLGIVLAYTVLAEVGNFVRFATGRHLSSYACLVPVADDSGDDDGSAPQGRHIGHMGRRTLQWAFIEAAHGAVRKDAWLREIYHRRTDNGKRDRNRGYIAVARQLCRVSYACVKQNRPYHPAAVSVVDAATGEVSVENAPTVQKVPTTKNKKETKKRPATPKPRRGSK